MNAIVAVDQNWAIGRNGNLLFSLPTDMRHFRTATQGGTVIMGRKTLDSFPNGRPLPKRRNIVITRNRNFIREGAEVVFSAEEAVALAGDDCDQLWVIGGSTIYQELLPQCRRVLLTRVETAAESPDTFFPNLDQMPEWKIESTSEPMTENGLTYRFITYINTTL